MELLVNQRWENSGFVQNAVFADIDEELVCGGLRIGISGLSRNYSKCGLVFCEYAEIKCVSSLMKQRGRWGTVLPFECTTQFWAVVQGVLSGVKGTAAFKDYVAAVGAQGIRLRAAKIVQELCGRSASKSCQCIRELDLLIS